MNHEEYRIQVSQHLDGELERDQEIMLFSHLAGCEECREFLRSSLQLRMQLHAAPPRLMPESLHIRSTGRGYTPQKRANKIYRLWQTRIPLPVAAIVVFLVLAGTFSASRWWLSSNGRGSNGSQAVFVMPEVVIERSTHSLTQ